MHGNEIWNYETKGYVRSVRPLNDGGVLAGSHDNKIYILNDKGEVVKNFETGGEITCVCSTLASDYIYAGAGNTILAFDTDEGTMPAALEEPSTPSSNVP